MSAGDAPGLNNSTQSPGDPPLDSTSLIFTTGTPPAQSLAAPLVELPVVVNAPEPFGQRPYVVAACGVHEKESTITPLGVNSRAASGEPRPKPCAPSSMMK